MINFFRKIRQRLLTENKTGKYLKYGIGEIVLVVVGILIALQINNWNEDRKSKILEKATIKELAIALNEDLKDIDINIKNHKITLTSQKLVVNWLNSELPYSDSLCYNFGWSNYFSFFISDNAAFETLKTKGLSLISNDSLRTSITHLYGYDYNNYNHYEVVYTEFAMRMINVVNSRYFSDSPFPLLQLGSPLLDFGCMRPNNINEIKEASDYEYHLKTCRNLNIIFIGKMESTRNNLIKLIDMLELELRK